MELIDSHAHLNDSRFSADREQVLCRAAEAGVAAVLNVGFDLPSSRLAVELARDYPALFAAVGIHPHDASDADEEALAAIAELAAAPRVVAIGETGLDFFRNLSPPPRQREAFARFIGLAAELQKPLIVHCREAQEEVLAVLDANRAGDQPVVMHCFAGDVAFAEQCLQRGFYLGLAGTVTYPKSPALREVAACAPAERLLMETDCPWLPPQAHRGQRNEPAYVRLVAETVAAARGITRDRQGALQPLSEMSHLPAAVPRMR